MSKKRMLLLSNTSMHGFGPLEHCADAIKLLLGDARELFFVPFAAPSLRWDQYTKMVADLFADSGVQVRDIRDLNHDACDSNTTAFWVGGGNTFRLLSTLYSEGLVDFIAERVADGVPYIGTSAGSNVACPTIMTTNDMPIVQIPKLEAMGLVSFQINAHYVEPASGSTHMGETRAQRIAEFHQENEAPVVGLREGSWLRVEDERVILEGTTGAMLFRRDQTPVACTPCSDITKLLT